MSHFQNHNMAFKPKKCTEKCEENYKNLLKLTFEYADVHNQNEELIKRIEDLEIGRWTEVRDLHKIFESHETQLRSQLASLQAQLDEQDLSICLMKEEIEELNAKISNLNKDLAEKDKELEQAKNRNSELGFEISSQRTNFQSQIRRSEQSQNFNYTHSQVERDQQEIINQANQIQDLSDELENYKTKSEHYKNLYEKSIKKCDTQDAELDRAFKILTSVISLLNSDPNYNGQTTLNFQNRHLPNPKLKCEFEISCNDRIYKHFLSLVGAEAKIRMEKIVQTGKFPTTRPGISCNVNTVIFGKTLDMDARKSDVGLSLCFTSHNPVRMHKNHAGKFNHLTSA